VEGIASVSKPVVTHRRTAGSGAALPEAVEGGQ